MVGMLSGGKPDSREKHSAILGKGQPKSGSRRVPDQEDGAEDGEKRAMSVRERQEIQEVLWRMKFWGRELVSREMRPTAQLGAERVRQATFHVT